MTQPTISLSINPILVQIATICVVFVVPLGAEPPIPTDPPTVLVDEDPGTLMRGKLTRSKEVLEGLLRKDFDSISRVARELKRISEAAAWSRHDDKVYDHFSIEFRRQCNELEKAALELNDAGVKFAYLNMTTTCINCHDYVRDSQRVANSSRDGSVRFVPGR